MSEKTNDDLAATAGPALALFWKAHADYVPDTEPTPQALQDLITNLLHTADRQRSADKNHPSAVGGMLALTQASFHYESELTALFDPEGMYDHTAHAIEKIMLLPEHLRDQKAWECVHHNVEVGEIGWAKEFLYDYFDMYAVGDLGHQGDDT